MAIQIEIIELNARLYTICCFRSNNLTLTTAAAEKVHGDGVIMFAVGVTQNTNQVELDAIGSDPDCLHVFNLVHFTDIPHFKNEITRRSCRGERTVY